VRYRCISKLDYQKLRIKKIPEIQDILNSNPVDPHELAVIIEIEHKYLQVLESLSPKCRKVFEMSRLEGRKNQEIADELGLSKRTVETHITLALKVLRRKLHRYLTVMAFYLYLMEFFSTCKIVFNCYN
jgi:RNA polymerase sigma-70 factor (ECF subfamily)